MPDYQFSTIKIVPRSVSKEPVAIGVILYDPKKGEVYRRFTDNWDEVRRRTGFATLPDIRSITTEGPIEVGEDYLANLSANQFPDTLLVTQPNNLMPFDTPHDALEWTFVAHVGPPPRTGLDSSPGRSPNALLGEKIVGMGFGADSYRNRYEFRLDSLCIQFPHVFLKDGVPHNALFATSVLSSSATNAIKSRVCDILSIQKWYRHSVAFMMCIVEHRHDAERSLPVRKNMGLLNKSGISVVYWDGVGSALEKIRNGVSPVHARKFW